MLKILILILAYYGAQMCNEISIPSEIKVSFDQGMSPSARLGTYNHSMATKDKDWTIAHKLFEKYLAKFCYSKMPTIPKKIHQIYVGNPVPEKCKILQKTWQKYHPDWEYYLWTDKEIDEFGLRNRDLYDATPNLAQKSDIARYEILYRYGGLYVDMDFECIRPFDIFHHTLNFYAGIEYNKNLRINNALIASAPNHPILKSCIERIKEQPPAIDENLPEIEKHIEMVVQQTGPAFLTRVILDHIDLDRITFFPNTFFYPFNVNDAITTYPETFAMHHWHMSWVKPMTELLIQGKDN